MVFTHSKLSFVIKKTLKRQLRGCIVSSLLCPVSSASMWHEHSNVEPWRNVLLGEVNLNFIMVVVYFGVHILHMCTKKTTS